MHFEVVRSPTLTSRRLRDSGIVLTAVGGAGLVLSTVFGVAEIVASASCRKTGCIAEPYLGSIATTTAAISAPFAIVGGSMSGVGQRRLDRSRIGVSVRGQVRPDGGTVGIDLVS
jgi:hypothetical protein